MTYISPVLETLDPTAVSNISNMPRDLVACKHCPASVWRLFVSLNSKEKDYLTCYCQVMREFTLSLDAKNPPSKCDAQIAALASLAAMKNPPIATPEEEVVDWSKGDLLGLS